MGSGAEGVAPGGDSSEEDSYENTSHLRVIVSGSLFFGKGGEMVTK